MTQIRRVTRSVDLPRSRRPAGPVAPRPALDLTNVVTLFPADAPRQTPKSFNIFARIDDTDTPTAAARARARALSRMAKSDLQTVTNIFAEDCPDLTQQDEAQMQSRIAAHPRRMETVRAEIVALHDELAAAHPLRNWQMRSMGTIVAGFTTLVAMVQAFPPPQL